VVILKAVMLFDKFHIKTFGLLSTSNNNISPGHHEVIAICQLPKNAVLIKWADF
jgi:hypothetical protein